MRLKGQICIRGIVQGVGFRPFVYAQAVNRGIQGTVRNLGSEVLIEAWGDRFEKFLRAVSVGTPLSEIDSVEVRDLTGHPPEGFSILRSGNGSLSGFIPADAAICDDCIRDIFTAGGRYENYWATSCVNCGPRYSIIATLPYDRERTTMDKFPMCPECRTEFTDPLSRRHHAQTIACATCGPSLALLDREGRVLGCDDPIKETAHLLEEGAVLAIRGIGGFHLSATEDSAALLKRRLGRSEQPLAVMAGEEEIREVAVVSDEDWKRLQSPAHPIVVLEKRDPGSHSAISNLHTIGCMLPYSGLHHLLFSHLKKRMLIMTSANMPGYPMITETADAISHLRDRADYFLVHDREILNRCDDSVIRDSQVIRLSRGLAPRRAEIDLGSRCILGTGPELNANISIYKDGFCITSPHVGNVRNPPTLAYLRETAEKIGGLMGAEYDIIAHDLHPRFLSTRYAHALAEEYGAETLAVQHHRAHIASVTTEPCIGIAIDGVGYGDDGTIWGGEIFAGAVPDLERVAHLETVRMPGGDLATRFPERMLYGILPEERITNLLSSRGWTETELGVLERQVERGFNVADTSSTGRVLDAASALLGICRERTYDGEPAMKLESVASGGRATPWDLRFEEEGRVFLTSALIKEAMQRMEKETIPDIAASFQYNLARGIAVMAGDAAAEHGINTIALSGGVAYNRIIRETILSEVQARGLGYTENKGMPLGDGCISSGQCIYAGRRGDFF